MISFLRIIKSANSFWRINQKNLQKVILRMYFSAGRDKKVLRRDYQVFLENEFQIINDGQSKVNVRENKLAF